MKTSYVLASLALITTTLGATTLVVSASEDNFLTRSQGGNRLEIPAIYNSVSSAGFSNIDEIELEDGAYEVEAIGPDGQRVELVVDAITGRIIDTEIKREKSERRYPQPGNTRF